MRRFFGKQKVENGRETEQPMPIWLRSILDGVAQIWLGPEEDLKEIMTYEEALGFFVTRKPEGVPVSKGVLIREQRSEGYLLIQAFLNAEDEFVKDQEGEPCMRQLLVKSLGPELQQAFGNQDIIVIQ